MENKKEYNSGFISKYKTGDNINYNLEILNKLYGYFQKETDDEKILLCKPIIIIISSITEALLSDFFRRIYLYKNEGIQNIESSKLKEIRIRKYKDFNAFIAGIKKYDLFNKNKTFYDEINELRILRNNIHIQKGNKTECFIFTIEEKNKAEKICKEIFEILSNTYVRNKNYKYVDNFKLPW